MIRYVATHINRQGMRTLTQPCQGRYTYATPEKAQAWIDAAIKNNREDKIVQVWGKQALGTFKVMPVECYETQDGSVGDPKGIYFD